MPHDIAAEIDAMVLQQMRMKAAAVEKACEMALQGGVCGVLIHEWAEYDDDGVRWSMQVGPSMDVPFGEIHHRDSPPGR